jgi:hypothetical protein
MSGTVQPETLVGRSEELRALRVAIQKRASRLLWGPTDTGKTILIKTAISELPDAERRNCVYWTGAASGRQLLSHFVGQLYERGDPFVRRKVHADGATESTLHRWLNRQSSLRLRGILFTASTAGDYRFFVDHFPPPTHNMARLMKEIMYRCETPVYLVARGMSKQEIGYAWGLYWNDSLRLHLGRLHERHARELLEICIRDFGLNSLDLEDFREDVLRLSGLLPGSIVKMSRLAADSRYHYGDRIKIKLVHVDYLMQSNPTAINRAPAFLQ